MRNKYFFADVVGSSSGATIPARTQQQQQQQQKQKNSMSSI